MIQLEMFQISFAIIIGVLAVFGIATNCLALVTIWKSEKLRSVFHLLIASLCFSDFISATISPLFAYRRYMGAKEWKLGVATCKLIWGLDFWTSYVTSMHITFFALIRLFSICRPQTFVRFTAGHAKTFIFIAWIVAGLCGCLPLVYWTGVTQNKTTAVLDNENWCRNKPTEASEWPSCTLTLPCLQHFRLYIIAAYSTFYYMPTVTMIVTTYSISWKIKKQRIARRKLVGYRTFPNKPEIKRRRKEYEITAQLMFIVGSFIVGYVPRAVYHHFTMKINDDLNTDWLFGMAAYTCMRLCESLNPIFYYLCSRKMRLETLRIFSEASYREAIGKTRNISLHVVKPRGNTQTVES